MISKPNLIVAILAEIIFVIIQKNAQFFVSKFCSLDILMISKHRSFILNTKRMNSNMCMHKMG